MAKFSLRDTWLGRHWLDLLGATTGLVWIAAVCHLSYIVVLAGLLIWLSLHEYN